MFLHKRSIRIAALALLPGMFGNVALLQAETSATAGQPLTITVNGHRYPIAVVRIRDKQQIILSTQHEFAKFPAVKLTINFTSGKLTQLSGQSLHFSGKNFSEPNLLLSWLKPGKSLPSNQFISKNYDLTLRFGQEKDYRIPLEFTLKTSEGVNLSAVGKQLARTSDLRVVNGKVDRQQDNIDTVLYVAARFIQRQDKLANLPKLEEHGYAISMPGQHEKPDPSPVRVFSSTELNFDFVGAKGKEKGKFQMVRDHSGWRVYRVLSPARLRAATQVDLHLDTLFMYDYFGEQVVNHAFGKDKVKTWESKNKMLQNTNADSKLNQDQYGLAAYRVTLKDGSQQYIKLLAKKQGIWKVAKVVNGSQVMQAHMAVRKNKRFYDTYVQKHLAAVRLEKALNKRYAHLQIRSSNFSCGVSRLWSDCKATWYRLVDDKEQCEGTKYMYQRKDDKSPWHFVRELAADERLDHRDGQVKKLAKPTRYYCW